MKLVMHLKHDLSYKMCGTRELFLAFLGLNRAFGFILCIMSCFVLVNKYYYYYYIITTKRPHVTSDLWD